MKASQVVHRLPALVAGLVCLAALFSAGLQTLAVFRAGGDAYRVGDWLINYSGGFVRRGFFGQIALLEGQLLPGTLLPLLLLIQLTLYGALLWFGFHLARPHLAVRSSSVFLLLSPATFLFESLNPESFRKELLGLVLLAAICNQLRQSNSVKEHVVLRWLWGAAATLPLFVLSHEASVLFLPYIFLAVLSAGVRSSYRKPLIWMGGLTLLAFAAAVSHPGDRNTAEQIIFSLDGLVPEPSLSKHGRHGAILALRHSTSDAWHDLQSRIAGNGFEYPQKYAIVLLLSAVPFVLNHDYLRRFWAKHIVKIVLILTTAATVLLCALAKDWGRFIYLNATALAVVVLSSRSRPRLGSSAGRLVLLVSALMYATTWRVPISKPSLERGAIAQLQELLN